MSSLKLLTVNLDKAPEKLRQMVFECVLDSMCDRLWSNHHSPEESHNVFNLAFMNEIRGLPLWESVCGLVYPCLFKAS